MRRALAFTLAGTLLAAAQPAAACSVTDEYRLPTNLELVERADVILLATVRDSTIEEDSTGRRTSYLSVEPVAVLKGAPMPAPLRLPYMSAPERNNFRSDPDELERAHPESDGLCLRYRFVRDSMVLFFLAHRNGRLVPTNEPFSRYGEDVPSADSRWVRAVRLYVEVAALPEPERRAALLTRQAALRARSDDADAQAIADDIGRSLQGPNRPWNTIMRERLRAWREERRASEAAASDGPR